MQAHEIDYHIWRGNAMRNSWTHKNVIAEAEV
jgi:hypothetical protein